jgi:hypothetical protein
MTQGQGTFSMEFLRYKKVPNSIQEAIIKERNQSRNLTIAKVLRTSGAALAPR